MALDEKLILKIFPPALRSQFDSERGSLRSFADGQRAVKIFAP
jgi:hypothetical protein